MPHLNIYFLHSLHLFENITTNDCKACYRLIHIYIDSRYILEYLVLVL